jgi:S-adenosylmethionine-diacylgycerolhomoserine-N-methlytransferase
MGTGMRASTGFAALAADAGILWRMLRGQPRQGSHAERLEAFYAPQAGRYDAFRARLLQGREALLAQLGIAPGVRVVELGCGTGASLAMLGDRVWLPTRIDLVDLCPALLDVARQRSAALPHVHVTEADATHWQPARPADIVFLSYALTMMPDWRATLDNACRMLAPGGRLGVVDFHLPLGGHRMVNAFWRRWFAHDGVHLSGDHLADLCHRFPIHSVTEQHAPVPYLPGARVPYYRFIGTAGADRTHYPA